MSCLLLDVVINLMVHLRDNMTVNCNESSAKFSLYVFEMTRFLQTQIPFMLRQFSDIETLGAYHIEFLPSYLYLFDNILRVLLFRHYKYFCNAFQDTEYMKKIYHIKIYV